MGFWGEDTSGGEVARAGPDCLGRAETRREEIRQRMLGIQISLPTFCV